MGFVVFIRFSFDARFPIWFFNNVIGIYIVYVERLTEVPNKYIKKLLMKLFF